MARPSEYDPVEKFRFSILVVSIDISATAAMDLTAAAFPKLLQSKQGKNLLSVVSRAGFSEVILPSVAVNEMLYRENVDNQRFTRIPGLATYTPVVLKRGVTGTRDLYNWYRLVHDDQLLLASAQELTNTTYAPPLQTDNFRKEVIINVHNRDGEPVKQWMLFNAYPSMYKGGDNLDAGEDTKLIEELTLNYEFFLELEGGIDGLLKELAKDATENVLGYAGNAIGGIL